MTLRSVNLLVLIFCISACVSKSKYVALSNEHTRIKNDSLLLEKRIRQLNDENVRLATESAKMEQAMNERLQEKQDSLNYKETLIQERELSLKDMKARKEEEREAFTTLSRQIAGDFSDYDKQTLITSTGCTQIIVSVNDKRLFSNNSIKPEYMVTELNNKTMAILKKYPDVRLTIVVYADSVSAANKAADASTLPYSKANILYRSLVQTDQQYKSRIGTGIKNEAHTRIFASQVDYVFYSELLPCIYTK